MHFTLVFSGPEAHDLSFGLVFTPNPCWVRGNTSVLVLNPNSPQLEPSAIPRLLNELNLRDDVTLGGNRCTIISHAGGHGTSADLALLKGELEQESITVQLVDQTA